MSTQPVFCWHVHHDIIVEPLTKPLECRIVSIKRNKPSGEIETRLRLMRPVRGRLPKGVVGAGVAYTKALKAHKAEIEALHEKECPDCPWDGRTIFLEK